LLETLRALTLELEGTEGGRGRGEVEVMEQGSGGGLGAVLNQFRVSSTAKRKPTTTTTETAARTERTKDLHCLVVEAVEKVISAVFNTCLFLPIICSWTTFLLSQTVPSAAVSSPLTRSNQPGQDVMNSGKLPMHGRFPVHRFRSCAHFPQTRPGTTSTSTRRLVRWS